MVRALRVLAAYVLRASIIMPVACVECGSKGVFAHSTYICIISTGIGHFTILDSQDVSPEDAGNNFFLHQSSIGKSRAKESVQHLSELNDAVEAVADTSVRTSLFYPNIDV